MLPLQGHRVSGQWGRVFNVKTGKFIGENHLGRILMAQRDELRRKQKED